MSFPAHAAVDCAGFRQPHSAAGVIAAENALVALQHERQIAWIALYRAAGGGWTL